MRRPMDTECAALGGFGKAVQSHGVVIFAPQPRRAGDGAANEAHVRAGRDHAGHDAVLADTGRADHGDEATGFHAARAGVKRLTSISRSQTRVRAASSWKMPMIAAPRALASSISDRTTSRLAASRLA